MKINSAPMGVFYFFYYVSLGQEILALYAPHYKERTWMGYQASGRLILTNIWGRSLKEERQGSTTSKISSRIIN